MRCSTELVGNGWFLPFSDTIPISIVENHFHKNHYFDFVAYAVDSNTKVSQKVKNIEKLVYTKSQLKLFPCIVFNCFLIMILTRVFVHWQLFVGWSVGYFNSVILFFCAVASVFVEWNTEAVSQVAY